MLQTGTGGRSALIFSARLDTLNPDHFKWVLMPQSQLFSDVQNKFMQDCSSPFPLKYFVFQGFISYDMASVHSGLIRRGCVGMWQEKTGPLTTWSFIKRFTSGSVRSEACNTVTLIRQLWLPTSGRFYDFITEATSTPFPQGSSGRSPKSFTAISSNRENPPVYLFYQ